MTLQLRVALIPGLLLVVTACSGDGPGSDAGPPLDATSTPPDGAAFCETVEPRVQAWLDRTEAERTVPDDLRYGGTLVVSASGELDQGMNAFTTSDYGAVQHQLFVNLMTLIQYDEELEPVPYLAESWEVAPDTTSVTFRLRDDVSWHDGTPTTARDVAFTYLRVTDPATAYPNAAFWDDYVVGEEGVEVVDSFTVRVRLARPHAGFMDPWRTLAVMPAHLLEEVPPAELAGHPFGTRCPVGNGPFVFDDHRPQERWSFVANPAFPTDLGGRPFVDRYVFRIISEPTTQLTELLNGRTDVYISPPADHAERIREAPHLELLSFVFRDYVFVAWNARRPALADPRVRRALTLGIDRSEIVEALLGPYGTVANTGVPPFHWAYDPAFEDALPHDPQAARELLEAAGWVDRDDDGVRENGAGEPLRIGVKYNRGNQQRQSLAEIMQAQLADVGVEIVPEVVEWGTLLDQINDPERRDFDGVVLGWANEFKLDDRDLFHSERIDQPSAWAGTRNPELDRLMDSLPRLMDREEARPVWSRYQEALIQEQPFTFLYFRQRLEGVNRRLRDVEMDVRGEWISIKDWWIAPEERRSGP
jgi:peptide/nickel transport system substrate-binding protein